LERGPVLHKRGWIDDYDIELLTSLFQVLKTIPKYSTKLLSGELVRLGVLADELDRRFRSINAHNL
jgi:hypothetical protein